MENSSSKNIMITHITRMGYDHLCLAGIDVDKVLSDAEPKDCNIRPLLTKNQHWSIKDLEDIELYGIYKFYGFFKTTDGSKEDFIAEQYEKIDLDENFHERIFKKYFSKYFSSPEEEEMARRSFESNSSQLELLKLSNQPSSVYKFSDKYFLLHYSGNRFSHDGVSLGKTENTGNDNYYWFKNIVSTVEENFSNSNKEDLIYKKCSHVEPWSISGINPDYYSAVDLFPNSIIYENYCGSESRIFSNIDENNPSEVFTNIHISNHYTIEKFKGFDSNTLATVRTEELLYYRKKYDGQQRVIINLYGCQNFPDCSLVTPTPSHSHRWNIDIPITDYRFFDYDKDKNSFFNKPFSEIKKLFESDVVYVSIGLTRDFKGSRWLQLNNFHFVNDLLEEINTSTNTEEFKCPLCKSQVLDHRENKPSRDFPHFRCSNEECDQGNGYPWSSWNEDEFD